VRNILKANLPNWAYAMTGAAIMALAAAAEFALGRKLWGVAGQAGIWSGSVWSEHNSQYIADPYTFSHITHGILLYGFLWLVGRKLPRKQRAVLALALESIWEVIENTDMVIGRYRAATRALNYYGDSVTNSMGDILACMLGFLLASMLPTGITVAGAAALEIALALTIRDGLVLNVLMLIDPIRAVKTWQLGK
jgi:Protein of unknown function (DUF2585)